jgi:riboflavin transporter FmnP
MLFNASRQALPRQSCKTFKNRPLNNRSSFSTPAITPIIFYRCSTYEGTWPGVLANKLFASKSIASTATVIKWQPSHIKTLIAALLTTCDFHIKYLVAVNCAVVIPYQGGAHRRPSHEA